MFETLNDKFEKIVRGIRGKAVISESDLDSTLREIRIALLEADVALVVVKDFINSVKENILGKEVLKSIKPDQMIIKLVQDELVNILGSENQPLNIATDKRRQYIDQTYWGKPITGYGDHNSQLLMIGLAPAAHGGNRTGRVFTGDKSADFLFKCLYKAGFANQSISISRDDGLKLKNLYLTTALKCVPPEDKPKPNELKTCFKFFREEINYLTNINTIVALGKIAFDACLNFYMQDYDLKKKNFVFQHGSEYMLPDKKILIGSYHPSPRNVNTGRIDENKMMKLLKAVKNVMDR